MTPQERQAIRDAGVTNAREVDEQIMPDGSISRLIRGKAADEMTTVWGRWNDGESARDIRWSYEKHNA